jgi:hypothetical protein
LAYIKIQHIYSKVSIPMVVKLNFIDKDGWDQSIQEC